jgi:hypothetical protein
MSLVSWTYGWLANIISASVLAPSASRAMTPTSLSSHPLPVRHIDFLTLQRQPSVFSIRESSISDNSNLHSSLRPGGSTSRIRPTSSTPIPLQISQTSAVSHINFRQLLSQQVSPSGSTRSSKSPQSTMVGDSQLPVPGTSQTVTSESLSQSTAEKIQYGDIQTLGRDTFVSSPNDTGHHKKSSKVRREYPDEDLPSHALSPRRQRPVQRKRQ